MRSSAHPAATEERARRWRVAASVLYALAMAPAVAAALRHGAAPGDVRHTARMLHSMYGSGVAGYLGSAPRAVLAMELDALTVLPVVLWVAIAPRAGQLPRPRALLSAAAWAGAFVCTGHAAVFVAMLVHGAPAMLAWTWSWRLAVITLVSGVAELGLIATLLGLVGTLRRGRCIAIALWLMLGLVGIMLRVTLPDGGGYVLPAAVDSALLTGRPSAQAIAGFVALCWLAVGSVLARHRSIRRTLQA